MGKFVVSKRKNDEYQFTLVANNGEVILVSEGYTTKANCDNGIESVRVNAKNDSAFERNRSKDDKFFFNLKASNGQVIGTSQMYQEVGSMEIGIQSVKKNAPAALVEL